MAAAQIHTGKMMHRNRLGPPTAVVLTLTMAAGLLSGCAGTPEPTPPTAASATPAPAPPAVTEVRLDTASLPDLQPQMLPVQPVGFAIAGDPGLQPALGAAVDQASRGGLVVRVTPIASSGNLVGFRLRSSSPDGTPVSTGTLWFSRLQQRVVADRELLADGAAPAGGVSFTAAGEVYLESVVDGAFRAEAADPARLSVLGRLAQHAAVAATNPAPRRAVDCTVQRCIALTFDDGPSEVTPDLLQTLAANDAAATFYIRGSSVAGREQTLHAMSVAGHQIGNHSQNHLRLPEQDPATIAAEIDQTRTAIAAFPANGSATFRPPYGRYDNTVVAAAADAGYSVVLWTLDPVDYRTTDSALIIDRVLSAARPGAVVLSHDTLPHTETAYRTIIPQLRRAGYELVTVDQLLGPGSPGQVRRGGATQ